MVSKEITNKLIDIQSFAPVLLARLQSGEIELSVAGEAKLLFENLSEVLKNGIKSKMITDNIEYESNGNVELKLQYSRKFNYSANTDWLALEEEIMLLREEQKRIEKEIREATGDSVTIEKRLVISKKR